MSTRQTPPSLVWVLPTPSNTAKRRRPRELHPFIQKAASSTSTRASFSRERNAVTSRRTSSVAKMRSISRFSSSLIGQNRLPSGIVGLVSSRRSCRISDYRLIEVADLDIDLAVGISQGTQISDMAIPANPDRRTLRHLAAVRGGKPFVKL